MLFRNEAPDIFGSKYGETYVTITTDKKSISVMLRIQTLKYFPKDLLNIRFFAYIYTGKA